MLGRTMGWGVSSAFHPSSLGNSGPARRRLGWAEQTLRSRCRRRGPCSRPWI